MKYLLSLVVAPIIMYMKYELGIERLVNFIFSILL